MLDMFPSTTIKYDSREFDMFGFSDRDLIFRRWRETKTFYEEPLLSKIRSMDIGGCYVDAGANQGNHTIFFSEFCRSSEIVSVEASRVIRPILEKNSNTYVTKPLSIIDGCLYSVDGKRASSLKGVDPLNCGGTEFAVTPDGSGDVVTITLDSLLHGKDVGLLKLDLEGMEMSALQGAIHTIEKCRPVVFAEAWKHSFRSMIDRFLAELGYKETYSFAQTYCWEHTSA